MESNPPVAGAYAEADRHRWVPEPPSGASRTAFERDRARVLHSAALRRLADKTQVVGPQTDDFVRNRLTHTLEVAQVGRDLARTLGCDPDVVETGALAHDLGHPPFGHNGERALDDLSQACGGFEGNAQTLRILTRLEAKSAAPGPRGRSVGLNLTRATLDACCKYPWPRDEAAAPAGVHGDGTARTTEKFGVYADDAEVFAWLREGAQPRRRCLEAQVMDLADDVAYSVHDVEDGVVAGRISLPLLDEDAERAALWDTVRSWYAPDAADDELEQAWAALRALPTWSRAPYDGSRGALAVLKNLTSDLIGRFCTDVAAATRAQFGPPPLVRFDADVVVPPRTRLEVALLKGVAAHYVMSAEDRVAVLARQRSLITALVEALTEQPSAMQPAFRADLAAASDDGARQRVVVDQVASLTDSSAARWHARLCGAAAT